MRQVATALVDDEAIHWRSAEGLARSPREQRMTRELRLVAQLAQDAGPPPVSPASGLRVARPSVLERVVVTIAVLHVGVALLTWAMVGGVVAAEGLRAACVASAATAALVLRVRPMASARSRALAHVIWLLGALEARPFLDVASQVTPVWLHAGWQALHVEAFLPLACWRFVRECPLVVRFTPFDRLSRAVLLVAILSSLLLAGASGWSALSGGAPASLGPAWLHAWSRQAPAGLFWSMLLAWAAVSGLTMAVRTRQVVAAEARGVWLFLGAVALGSAPLLAVALRRGDWPTLGAFEAAESADRLVVGAGAIAAPWLAVGALLLHERHVCRYRSWRGCLLSRAPQALALIVAISLVLVAAHVVTHRGQPLNLLWDDAAVRGPVTVATVCMALLASVLAHAWRDRLWHRPRGSGVAQAAEEMRRGRTPREVATALVRHVQRALDASVAAVVAPDGPHWTAMAGEAPTLEGETALAAILAAPADPVRLDPSSRLFALLPGADRAWLERAGFDVLAPIVGADGRTMAGLMVGRRRDGRRHTRRDLAFLAAAVATAAMAFDACGRRHREAGDAPEPDDLPHECGRCGRLAAEGGTCGCGAPRQLASLPLRIGDKFQIERCLGRGGMGVVYLATDLRLGRAVALKTLPRLSPAAVTALHAEARAMAAVEHPSVALLYGLEVWRDTPVLVVEYLAGGTLASRVAEGPLPALQAVHLAGALADTLAELHRRGWLHGDLKPSNIGLDRTGAPKLLDFGLTRLLARSHPGAAVARVDGSDAAQSQALLAGTPLYLSPEAFDGRPCGEDVDVWALSLVLFEMVTGVHPFRSTSFDDMLHRVRRTQPVDVRRFAPHVAPPLAELLRHALHPQISLRIATAHELAAALRVVSAQL